MVVIVLVFEGYDNVRVNTDSKFMIDCAQSWMPNWKENGWKKVDGTDVVNKDDLIKLDQASKGMNVEWVSRTVCSCVKF